MILANVRQIAKLAGVSPTTVSLALHHHPRISEETCKRIQDIAQSLNYVTPDSKPNGPIRAPLIGYLADKAPDRLAMDMLRGAMEDATRRHFGLLLHEVAHCEGWIEEAITTLIQRNVSGMIFATSYPRLLPPFLLRRVRIAGIHLVQVMHAVLPSPVDSVCSPDADYAQVCCGTLHALGHRRIMLLNLTHPEIWEGVSQRYGMALTCFGQPEGIADPETLFAAYVHMTPRPTALIAHTDEAAMRCHHLAQCSGIAVPAQLSILGLGNASGGQLDPELSVLDMKACEMGRVGMNLLIDRILAGHPPALLTDHAEIKILPTLIDRGTLGPASLG